MPVPDPALRHHTVAIDAMSGDRGPEAVVAGVVNSARNNPDSRFLMFGHKATLERLLERHTLMKGQIETRDAKGVVTMHDKPSQVIRNSTGTSMWAALEAVRQGEAQVCVSCGNTGALMALSMLRLRRQPGINRPAIAALWPSRNKGGFNIMLDMGADVKANAQDLLQYAVMGASYARKGLKVDHPRVGLLNVGTEAHKGPGELHEAHALISERARDERFDFVGFVEGNDIPSSKVDVIVTDGFTGNVALKTAEGTASLIREALGRAFKSTLLSQIGALLASASLQRLREWTDTRRANGGVFLGLNGIVVKSHGSADPTGVSAAIKLALDLSRSTFDSQAATIAPVAPLQGAAQQHLPTPTNKWPQRDMA